MGGGGGGNVPAPFQKKGFLVRPPSPLQIIIPVHYVRNLQSVNAALINWGKSRLFISYFLILIFQDEESLYFILTYAERGDFFTFLKRAFKKG